MSVSYGWEKLYIAMHTLAGPGPQRQRLIDALTYELHLIRPDENLPPEAADDWRELYASLTRYEASGSEGSIAATVNRLSDDEVRSAVGRIISIFSAAAKADRG